MTNASPVLRMALCELRQGWRHFATFLACLILGVCVITTINTISDTVETSLAEEASALLGGDIDIGLRSYNFAPEHVAYLQKLGKISHITTTRSMLRIGEQSPLVVEVKAIDSAYPLVGDLILQGKPLNDTHVAVDASLLEQLNIALGATIKLGQAEYIIGATIEREPDRVVQLFSFGPRVMMTHNALERSGLTKGYSLSENNYRVSLFDKISPANVENEITATFPDMPWRIKTGTDGNRSVERFVDQLALFLTLSGLATFLIGGIGIGSSVRAYMTQKAETIAVMKIMGASRAKVLRIYALVIGLLTLAGSAIGVALSTLIAAVLLTLASGFFPVDSVWTFSVKAAALAAWYGLLIAYLFSLPALIGALNIRPSLLFRGGVEFVQLSHSRWVWLGGAAFTALLICTLLFTANDIRFVLGFIGATLVSFILFTTAAWLVRFGAKRTKVRQPWLRLALGNLHRTGNTTGTVMLAIGVSLTVLIALTLTEANFQSKITKVAETEAPTLFMIDIQPDQTAALRSTLKSRDGAQNIMMYPMVRGRIVAINEQPITPDDVKEDVRWAVRGDRGLSYSSIPPENANIVQGKWWPEDYDGTPQVSVDERFIDGMGIALGDTITLDILGERIIATVTSARRMDYSTFQLNFALMLSPNVISDFPQTYLATAFLNTSSKSVSQTIRHLSEQFPNVTTIRTTEAVARVKEILEHISNALTITVLISLLAGLLVLSSALSAMLGYRLYDTAVLKVLGARRRDILKAYTTEWMLLAVITVCIAAATGTFCAWLTLQRFPGENDFYFMPHVLLVTALACIGVIWLVGYVGNRQIFRMRPITVLRNE